VTHSEELRHLIEDLATQDNAATQNPIFVVEQRRTVDGLVPEYGEETLWNVHDGDGLSTLEEAIDYYEIEGGGVEALLEAGAEETGVAYVWVFVSAHFTRREAQRYLDRNAHRLTEPRVTVESLYRCPGMIAARALLLALHGKLEEVDRLLEGHCAREQRHGSHETQQG